MCALEGEEEGHRLGSLWWGEKVRRGPNTYCILCLLAKELLLHPQDDLVALREAKQGHHRHCRLLGAAWPLPPDSQEGPSWTSWPLLELQPRNLWLHRIAHCINTTEKILFSITLKDLNK